MSRRSLYDWGAWFSSPVTVLVRGRDYRVSNSSMVAMLRNQAARRGVSIKVVDERDRVTMWLSADTAPPAQPPDNEGVTA